MPLRTRALFLLIAACLIESTLATAQPQTKGAFSDSAQELRQSASLVKADPEANVTLLLNEETFAFDNDGRAVDTFHNIYRIEKEEAVKSWAESSVRWEPWHQSKPEIRARVITAEGTEHLLDPKTLTDVPVHQDSPETYSDKRSYGGPLPAVAVGAIVEEEIVLRDTAPFFAGGFVQRLRLRKGVPVISTRITFSHPESLKLRYLVEQMPTAKITKSQEAGVETIVIENGLIPARRNRLTYLPPDVVPDPQITFSTGESWQQVAHVYARQTDEKLRNTDPQPLLAKLDLPAKSSMSRNQLISRAVIALHKNVRYTGVEFGDASLIPASPTDTLKRKYGDCKDKSSLLITMLRSMGIDANLALLDSGPGQDINPELPGLGMFDHAIVHVPASGKEGELWIDATAQYNRVGDLPYMDYGRWALVVDEKTTALTKTPQLTAERNLHREFREFKLAEFGLATISERNEDTGAGEAGYRDFYAEDSKELREKAENYVKREYLAEKLVSLEHNNAADLDKPFVVTFTSRGKRGSTSFENAIMAIRIEDLFGRLPDYFLNESSEKKEDQDGDLAAKDEPRVQDWQINPFITEWNYRIIAPPGYKLRALPPAQEKEMGPARLTQRYSANPEGTVVEGVLRFESGKARLTVAEARSLREQVLKARKSDPIYISFDQIGSSLIAAGQFREGLQEYERLIRLHPKEALHKMQFANALLRLGLGEQARAVAKDATIIEPNSAQAFSTLGNVLQHDLVGRLRKKGFDYEGAVAAYRKAKELDPKDNDIRVELGILLEYDADGERYTSKARLKEAIAEMRELRDKDKDYFARYEDNLLYDLWYAGDLKGLPAELSKLPASDARRGFAVALTAISDGADAGVRKSLEITSDANERSQALSNAGALLLRTYRYSVAADLMYAGSRGQSNEAETAAYSTILRKAVPRSQMKIDDSTPASVVQKFFSEMFTAPLSYSRMKALLSSNADRKPDPKKDEQEMVQAMSSLRVQMEKEGLPFQVIGDIAVSNMHFSSEGDDLVGYKVTSVSPGTAPQVGFTVKEGGVYKLLEFTSDQQSVPQTLGWQALEELEKGNIKAARQWLDWAREQVHINETDDPLAGQPFPHFWTRGREASADEVRRAALVLAPSKELRAQEMEALAKLRDAATLPEEKQRLDLVIAYAYQAQEKWADLLPVAERLVQSSPDSLTAFAFAEAAYSGTRRLNEWQKLVDERLARHPGDPDYIRSAARLWQYKGDYERGRQLIKGLIDQGKATASDQNMFAWAALFIPGGVDQAAIETAESANRITKNENFAIMHTLACLYARAGKPSQARDLMLKAMAAAGQAEPDSSSWLAFGIIAEAYGAPDAARPMLARVEKLKTEFPGSNYELAQQRLASMEKSVPTKTTAMK